MIIVRDVFGGISINPVHLYIDGNEISAGFRDYAARVSEFFESKEKTNEALDWIFEQMKTQRGAANIIIDMKECPFLKEVTR